MVDPRKLFGRLGNSMFQYAYLYAQYKRGEIPDIYLQDPSYFEDYHKEIKELFSEGIGFLPYISVHVRRAKNPINPDEPAYSENSFYVNLSETDYYERAMDMFPYDNFLVFSDDPEWCRNKWKDNPRISFMGKGDEVEDLNLMASCKGNIIANSSYSWWAAYLNPNPGAVVVAPKQWFADGKERIRLSDKWITI